VSSELNGALAVTRLPEADEPPLTPPTLLLTFDPAPLCELVVASAG
jgi:hypothetical protein